MLKTLNVLSKEVIRLQKFAENADKSAKKILPEINSRLPVLEQAMFSLLAKKPLAREENRELAKEFSIDFADMKRQFSEMARGGTIQ